MRRPDADPFHLREVLDHFIVGHFRQSGKIQLPALRPFGHVDQIGGLLFRQTHRSHLVRRELQNACGRDGIAGQESKALENRLCRLAVQLLVDDGLGQTVEDRFAVCDPARADARNNPSHYGIAFFQVQNSFTHF